MSTPSFPFPTVTATLVSVFSATVAIDINTHWMNQRTGSPGTLTAAMSATDTTVALATQTAPGFSFVAVVTIGDAMVIDQEVMQVTGLNNGVYTVTRNVAPIAKAMGLPAPEHAEGSPVYVLAFNDPWVMMGIEALLPYSRNIVQGLGPNSATFGVQMSGSLVVTAPGS